MLNEYLTLTSALLQAPSAPIPLISNATLTSYINNARLQVAAMGVCVRVYGTLPLVIAQRQYNFSAVAGRPTGVDTVYHIRQLWYQRLGTAGQIWIPSRPFEYMSLYGLNKTLPASGEPTMWAQFGQGTTGSIFVDPLPDQPYACFVDAIGVPTALVDDTTAEAIPDIWTLAVPFYAAWYGFMSLQRQSDADMMMKRFQEQMALARNAANPNILPENWMQSPDPMAGARLGQQSAGRAA